MSEMEKDETVDNSFDKEESFGFNDMTSIYNEMDTTLEEKAKKFPFPMTVFNVKSIIHQVLTNKYVQQMFRSQLTNQELSNQLREAIFEPKMTRSKLKEVLQTGQVVDSKMTRLKLKEALKAGQMPQTWTLAPISGCGSSHQKETLLDIDFEEDDDEDDDEYNPSQVELNHVSEDEESIMSSHASECGSPFITRSSMDLASPVRNSAPTAIRSPPAKNKVDDVILTDMGPPKSTPIKSNRVSEDLEEEMNNIALRTRSKMPLTDTSILDLESMINDPDATLDLYNFMPPDSPYQEFLYTLIDDKVANDEAGNDDDTNDPEYDHMQEAEQAEEDEDEMIFDKRSEITKKELRGLIDELLETCGEDDGFNHLFNLGLGNTGEENVLKEPPDQPVDVEKSCSDCQTSVPKSMFNMEIQEDQGGSFLETLGLNLDPRFLALKDFEFTEEEEIQLRVQLTQHVQLLAQTYVLSSYSTTSPELSEYSKESKGLLQMMKVLSDICSARVPNSFFSIPNLDAAVAITEMSFLDEPNGSTYLNFKQMDGMSTSCAFLYPELLPKFKLTSNSQCGSKNKNVFLTSEDSLLAMGLEMYENLPNKIAMIKHCLLPTKSEKQIIYRIRNLKRITRGCTLDNSLKYFFKYNKLPKFEKNMNLLKPNDIIPPIFQKHSKLPNWFSSYYSQKKASERIRIKCPVKRNSISILVPSQTLESQIINVSHDDPIVQTATSQQNVAFIQNVAFLQDGASPQKITLLQNGAAPESVALLQNVAAPENVALLQNVAMIPVFFSMASQSNTNNTSPTNVLKNSSSPALISSNFVPLTSQIPVKSVKTRQQKRSSTIFSGKKSAETNKRTSRPTKWLLPKIAEPTQLLPLSNASASTLAGPSFAGQATDCRTAQGIACSTNNNISDMVFLVSSCSVSSLTSPSVFSSAVGISNGTRAHVTPVNLMNTFQQVAYNDSAPISSSSLSHQEVVCSSQGLVEPSQQCFDDQLKNNVSDGSSKDLLVKTSGGKTLVVKTLQNSSEPSVILRLDQLQQLGLKIDTVETRQKPVSDANHDDVEVLDLRVNKAVECSSNLVSSNLNQAKVLIDDQNKTDLNLAGSNKVPSSIDFSTNAMCPQNLEDSCSFSMFNHMLDSTASMSGDALSESQVAILLGMDPYKVTNKSSSDQVTENGSTGAFSAVNESGTVQESVTRNLFALSSPNKGVSFSLALEYFSSANFVSSTPLPKNCSATETSAPDISFTHFDKLINCSNISNLLDTNCSKIQGNFEDISDLNSVAIDPKQILNNDEPLCELPAAATVNNVNDTGTNFNSSSEEDLRKDIAEVDDSAMQESTNNKTDDCLKVALVADDVENLDPRAKSSSMMLVEHNVTDSNHVLCTPKKYFVNEYENIKNLTSPSTTAGSLTPRSQLEMSPSSRKGSQRTIAQLARLITPPKSPFTLHIQVSDIPEVATDSAGVEQRRVTRSQKVTNSITSLLPKNSFTKESRNDAFIAKPLSFLSVDGANDQKNNQSGHKSKLRPIEPKSPLLNVGGNLKKNKIGRPQPKKPERKSLLIPLKPKEPNIKIPSTSTSSNPLVADEVGSANIDANPCFFEEEDAANEDTWIAELYSASTTIDFNKKASAQLLKKQRALKMKEKEDLMRSLLDEKLLESDPMRKRRDMLYAESYVSRVKERFKSQPYIFSKFNTVLYKFAMEAAETKSEEKSAEDHKRLYNELKELFADHEDLLSDYSGFLPLDRAVAVGCFTSSLEFEKARIFLTKLERYFKKRPQTFHKCLKALKDSKEGFIKEEELKQFISRQIRNNSHLLSEFSWFFPSNRPLSSTRNLFEEVNLFAAEQADSISANIHFEQAEIPVENCESMGTVNCMCTCHMTGTDVFSKRIKHCSSCGLKIIKGIWHIQSDDKVYRHAAILLPGNPHSIPENPPDLSKGKLPDVERQSNKLANVVTKSLSSKTKLKFPAETKTVSCPRNSDLSKETRRKKSSASASTDGNVDQGGSETKISDIDGVVVERANKASIRKRKSAGSDAGPVVNIEKLCGINDSNCTNSLKSTKTTKKNLSVCTTEVSVKKTKSENVAEKCLGYKEKTSRSKRKRVILSSESDSEASSEDDTISKRIRTKLQRKKFKKMSEEDVNINEETESYFHEGLIQREVSTGNDAKSHSEETESRDLPLTDNISSQPQTDLISIMDTELLSQSGLAASNKNSSDIILHEESGNAAPPSEYHDPVDPASKWSKDEDKVLLEMCQLSGSSQSTYSAIACSLGNKTTEEVCQRFAYLMALYTEMDSDEG